MITSEREIGLIKKTILEDQVIPICQSVLKGQTDMDQEIILDQEAILKIEQMKLIVEIHRVVYSDYLAVEICRIRYHGF